MTAMEPTTNGTGRVQQRREMPTSVFSFGSLSEVMEFADLLAESSLVPSAYKNKPGDIVIAVQHGLELGLAPMQALQSIASINGKPSLYGDAGRALVRNHPELADMDEGIEGQGDQRKAVCIITRRGFSPVHGEFSVQQAKTAKLWNKAGPWTQYPEDMLAWRAFWRAARKAFPDALHGLVGEHEARDIAPVAQDVTEKPTTALGAVRQQVAVRKIEVDGGKPADDAPPGEPAKSQDIEDPKGPHLAIIREAMKAAKIPAELVKAAVTRATGGTKLPALKAMPDLSLADLDAVAEVMGRWPQYRADWIVQVLELGPEAAREEFSGAAGRDLGGLDELTTEDMAAIESAFADDLTRV